MNNLLQAAYGLHLNVLLWVLEEVAVWEKLIIAMPGAMLLPRTLVRWFLFTKVGW